ncbi:MAG: TIGR02281 family clan AA aspartic protease [Alphaproteobacteria bacterium]
MRGRGIWLLGLMGGLVALVLILNLLFPGSLGTSSAQMQLTYGIVLLLVLCSGLGVASRMPLREVMKSALAWIAIGLALVTLYTYQDGFMALAQNMLLAVDPSQPHVENGMVTLRENSDGHFTASAEVNGARVRFLIDTGASDVVLTKSDARHAGIDVDNLSYTTPVSTANGMTMVAPVRLKTIRVGSIIVKDVRADVAGNGLDFSLLGMSYLRRLSSYEVSHRTLILKE